MKTCTLCKTEKPIEDFLKRKDQKDGLHFYCRPCLKVKKAESYQKNREKALATMATYRAENPEKVAAAKKRCYEAKPEQYAAKRKAQYAADPESAKARSKEWILKNKEHVDTRNANYRLKNRRALVERQAVYQKENKEKVNAYQNRYVSERYQRDALFAVRMVCRRRLLFAFSQGGYKKSTKTETILGCTFPELLSYLEAQFTSGMTWGNRGLYGWHIDHRIPLSSATTAEQMERLSHYTNLQPMWAADNWAKGAKMPHEIMA